MRLLVTCGPAYEPLDEVRRLTNFSTGKLGTELANYLADRGHVVTVLRGYYSTWEKPSRSQTVLEFNTTDNLSSRLSELAREDWDAVFHAAAVSDFRFGRIFQRNSESELLPVTSGKFATDQGVLLAELVPTRKILPTLRDTFPKARIVGWKYEVEAGRERIVAMGRRQIAACRSDACVLNGPGYGEGYGLMDQGGDVVHCATPGALYERLESLAAATR